jgi:outer membrane lipoprotein SlyB
MKTLTRSLAVVAVGLAMAGCVSRDGSPDRTGTGALAGGAIGAGSGAIIGGASGHAGAGALIGGAIGAITGTLVGHSMDEQERARLRAQAPQTYARVEQGQPLVVADVKAMAKAGVGDEIIISQIRSTHTVYRLSSDDIIDLHNSGVSQKVIDFMINTPSTTGTATTTATTATTVVVAQPPPPPPVETIYVSPGPGYIWCPGEWQWRGTWVWVNGRWAYPPHRSAVWVGGYWTRGQRGYVHVSGRWRY